MIANDPAPTPPEASPGARAFGLTIRARRVRAGVTLRACAERMGVTMTLLSYWEQGRLDMPADRRDAFERAIGGGA